MRFKSFKDTNNESNKLRWKQTTKGTKRDKFNSCTLNIDCDKLEFGPIRNQQNPQKKALRKRLKLWENDEIIEIPIYPQRESVKTKTPQIINGESFFGLLVVINRFSIDIPTRREVTKKTESKLEREINSLSQQQKQRQYLLTRGQWEMDSMDRMDNWTMRRTTKCGKRNGHWIWRGIKSPQQLYGGKVAPNFVVRLTVIVIMVLFLFITSRLIRRSYRI